MFHATITNGADQPFRFSGEVVPYDLQVLREHVLARSQRGARVEVRMPASLRPALERALRDISSRRGVVLVLRP